MEMKRIGLVTTTAFVFGVGALCGFLAFAKAADRVVIVNDREAAALVQLIDEALKSKGTAVVQNAFYWLNKIENAPAASVTPDRKEDQDKTQEPPK